MMCDLLSGSELYKELWYKTRLVEEKLAKLFSEKMQFSENLFKWKDNSLPDKYDYNCFEYTDQPTKEEFQRRLSNFIEKTRRNKLIIGYGGVDKYYR